MVMRLRKRERDRVAIIAEVLEMSRSGELKSNIMWKAGLSYLMLNGYLKLMVETGLLDESLVNKKVVFKTTARGLKFLYHCSEIMDLLDSGDDAHKLYGRIKLLPTMLANQVPSFVG